MRGLCLVVLVSILLAGCGSVVTPAPSPTSAGSTATLTRPTASATRAPTSTRVIPLASPTVKSASGNVALPQFVYFWRPNCVYCGQQEPIVDALEQEFADRVVVKRLNTYESANVPLVQKYGITGVPAVVLLGPSGNVLMRWIGLTQADRLRQGLAAAGVK